MTTAKEIEELNTRLSNSKPTDIIQEASELWPNLAISFSGAEDIALIDMASKLIDAPAIFTLDTGRLHGQTYEFIESVCKHYAGRICNNHTVDDSHPGAVEAFLRVLNRRIGRGGERADDVPVPFAEACLAVRARLYAR